MTNLSFGIAKIGNIDYDIENFNLFAFDSLKGQENIDLLMRLILLK